MRGLLVSKCETFPENRDLFFFKLYHVTYGTLVPQPEIEPVFPGSTESYPLDPHGSSKNSILRN